MKYEIVKARSLLSKPIYGDSWFHINRSLNSYRGCEFACSYCDGRSEYYYVDNFESHIRIKENAPDILRKELEREGFTSRSKLKSETLWSFLDDEDAKRLALKTPRRQVIGVCGGVSDGYQQAEAEHNVTRRNLEVLHDFGMPVFVLTKSNLVTRDIDVLEQIHERAFANVTFTITTFDPKIKKILEPKSASTADRFEALREIRKRGLFGGVMATPIIPSIGNNDENMYALAKEAKQVGAQYILFAGMTLKPGRQKEHFFRIVKNHFPEHFENIREIYAKNDRYGHADYSKVSIRSMIRGYKICKDVGISPRTIRHNLPFEHEINTKVLGGLLDIVFYQQYLLGLPWNKSKRIQEIAIRIEKGVENLQELQEQDALKGRLLLDEVSEPIVEQLMDTGTCDHLRWIESIIDEEIEKLNI